MDVQLQCIVGISTRKYGGTDFRSNILDIGRSLVFVATETERTHLSFQASFDNLRRTNSDVAESVYLRFSVSSGLEGIGPEEYDQKSKMAWLHELI